MLLSKLKMAAAALVMVAVVATGAITVRFPAAAGEQPPQQKSERVSIQNADKRTARPQPLESPKQGAADQRATQLARRAHEQAAAFDKLSRFSYQVRYRHGIVDSLRAVDVTFDRLKEGLTAPVLDKDWFGWYQTGFSWDEKRFIREIRPGDANLNYNFRFWTADDAWDRAEAKDKSSRSFVRFAGPAKLWNVPDHPAGSSINLFDFSYLRVTPHQYRWGRTVPRMCHQMTVVAPEKMTWKHIGIEEFGGEIGDIVESAGVGGSRLWISQRTGRIRGVLSYPFADSEPNELAQFDDYREIAPGVWLPFRESRSYPHASETAGKRLLRRSELVVEEARTNRDLADRYAGLLPKEGDRVQDQRFVVPVDYNYSAKRTDEEIRKMAEAEAKKR